MYRIQTKSSRLRKVVEIAARLALGGFFAYAAVPKMRDPALFADAVSRYDMLPGRTLGVFALFLPAFEFVCGLALAFSPFRREAAVAICAMLSMFMVALVQALVRGLDISCGCFGLPESGGAREIAVALVRDAALLVPAVWLALARDRTER